MRGAGRGSTESQNKCGQELIYQTRITKKYPSKDGRHTTEKDRENKRNPAKSRVREDKKIVQVHFGDADKNAPSLSLFCSFLFLL
mmetsp:Transcript_65148/g.74873  ORF Transcript_65148/g.74873 Transcript_65148/m.74873 type:complete len:85 (+) Transcript_65148:47-301(+)